MILTGPFTMINDAVRARAVDAVRAAPEGWIVKVEEPKRSDEAAMRFWAALRQFASETDHYGEKLPAETWRDIFLNALGREIKMVRALDGQGIIPVRYSTKTLKVREMSDLIELVYSEGSKRGIVFREPRLEPDWKPRQGPKAKRVAAREQLAKEGQPA